MRWTLLEKILLGAFLFWVACGLIYKLAPHPGGKWKYGVLYKFTGPDGEWPQGGVILDKQQKHLYGATEYGGAYGYGVVFEITP